MSSLNKNSTVVKIINNKVIHSNDQGPNYVNSNNLLADEKDNNKENNPISNSKTKTFVDDHNNNQLRIIKTENSFDTTKNSTSGVSTSSSSGTVARIQVSDGSASIFSQNNTVNVSTEPPASQQQPVPIITLNNAPNPINQSNISSNFSMSSSLVSSTISNQHTNASSSLSHTPNPNHMTESLQSGNLLIKSSWTLIKKSNLF